MQINRYKIPWIITIITILLVLAKFSFTVFASDDHQQSSVQISANALAIEGNFLYVAGKATGLSGKLPLGSLDLGGGMEDIWLAKLTLDGTPVYQALIGGSQDDVAFDLVVHQGVVYLIGETWSMNFPGAPGNAGENDAVLLALAADGSQILWARRFGGSDQDSGRGISLLDDSLYYTGITWSKDFVPGQAKGDADGFVGSVTLKGDLVWQRVFGGNGLDAPNALTVDSDSIWVAGQTFSINYGGVPLGGGDAFISQFALDGTPQFASRYGGRSEDMAFDINLQQNGDLLLVGGTQSDTLPEASGTYGGNFDGFLAALDREGKPLFSAYLGGSGFDYAYAVTGLPDGGILVAGGGNSTTFPTGYDQTLQGLGGEDAFVTLFDDKGVFQEAWLVGGEQSDRALDLALLPEGIWLAGKFSTAELQYATFLQVDQDVIISLPTQVPPITTATLSITAKPQPTETSLPTITNTISPDASDIKETDSTLETTTLTQALLPLTIETQQPTGRSKMTAENTANFSISETPTTIPQTPIVEDKKIPMIIPLSIALIIVFAFVSWLLWFSKKNKHVGSEESS